MDPLAAVSLVASVITFVDWGTKVVSSARDIYVSTSGTLAENDSREKLSAESQKFLKQLTSPGSARLLEHDESLSVLVAECQHLAEAILEKLRGVKSVNPRSKRSAIRAAWDFSRPKYGRELEILETRLDRCRNQLSLHLAIITSSRNEYMWANLQRNLTEDTGSGSVMLKHLYRVRNLDLASSAGSSKLTEKIQKLVDLESTVMLNVARSRFLENLRFQDKALRADTVATANENTLRWLVDDDPPVQYVLLQDTERTKLLNWLSHGEGIFHILGKLGSGKSTLMKFLSHHPRVQRELQRWAGDNALVIPRFFFWDPGSRLQNTMAGFYRSVLYDLLEACPDLISETFPEQWERGNRWSSNQYDFSWISEIHFQDHEILDGFWRLLSSPGLLRGRRVCIFVDGLDEHRGTSHEDHKDLVQCLKRLVDGNDGMVKLFVSSREEHAFTSGFRSQGPERRLSLHLLTRDDIRRYIEDRLGCVPDLSIREEITAIIVERSQGIFLWVSLVVKTIREQLDEDSATDLDILLEEVNSLPVELGDLFMKILTSQKKPNKAYRTLSMLLTLDEVTKGCPYPYRLQPTTFAYSFFDDYERDQDFALRPNFTATKMNQETRDDRSQLGQRNVAKYCQGLVEVIEARFYGQEEPPMDIITFTHRSVPEFLHDEWAIKAIASHTSDFNGLNAFSQLLLAAIQHGGLLEFSYGCALSPNLIIARLKRSLDKEPYRYLQSLLIATHPSWQYHDCDDSNGGDEELTHKFVPPGYTPGCPIVFGDPGCAYVQRFAWGLRALDVFNPKKHGFPCNHPELGPPYHCFSFTGAVHQTNPILVLLFHDWPDFVRWRLHNLTSSGTDAFIPRDLSQLIHVHPRAWSRSALSMTKLLVQRNLMSLDDPTRMAPFQYLLVTSDLKSRSWDYLNLWQNFALWLMLKTIQFPHDETKGEKVMSGLELESWSRSDDWPSLMEWLDIIDWPNIIEWLQFFIQHGTKTDVSFTVLDNDLYFDPHSRIFLVIHTSDRPITIRFETTVRYTTKENIADNRSWDFKNSKPKEPRRLDSEMMMLHQFKGRRNGVRISLRDWLAAADIPPGPKESILALLDGTPLAENAHHNSLGTITSGAEAPAPCPEVELEDEVKQPAAPSALQRSANGSLPTVDTPDKTSLARTHSGQIRTQLFSHKQLIWASITLAPIFGLLLSIILGRFV